MNIRKEQKGFTIIEVVLVLAIAGLIFMMVFIALPALQRSQRDSQRKNDLSRMLTKINDYTTNNRGQIPGSMTVTSGVPPRSFVQNYLATSANPAPSSTRAGSDFQDPQAGLYDFNATNTAMPATPPNPLTGQVYYNTSVICGTDGSTTGGNARQYTLRMFLEGQQTPYCVDNR